MNAAIPKSTPLALAQEDTKSLVRHLAKLQKALASSEPSRVTRALAAVSAASGTTGILPTVQQWLDWESTTRSKRLAAELRECCAASGVSLAVLTHAPLELRLGALTVSVQVERNRATLQFARIPVAKCRADAAVILAERNACLETLEGRDWDPEVFLGQLRAAWRSHGPGWVALRDLLPTLALARQSERFRVDPSADNFTPYPRAQLAYDLWRLRRDGVLAADGWRVSLGTAAGASARNKKNVLWLEDGRGRGQWYASIRFVQEVRDAR